MTIGEIKKVDKGKFTVRIDNDDFEITPAEAAVIILMRDLNLRIQYLAK